MVVYCANSNRVHLMASQLKEARQPLLLVKDPAYLEGPLTRSHLVTCAAIMLQHLDDWRRCR